MVSSPDYLVSIVRNVPNIIGVPRFVLENYRVFEYTDSSREISTRSTVYIYIYTTIFTVNYWMQQPISNKFWTYYLQLLANHFELLTYFTFSRRRFWFLYILHSKYLPSGYILFFSIFKTGDTTRWILSSSGRLMCTNF